MIFKSEVLRVVHPAFRIPRIPCALVGRLRRTLIFRVRVAAHDICAHQVARRRLVRPGDLGGAAITRRSVAVDIRRAAVAVAIAIAVMK